MFYPRVMSHKRLSHSRLGSNYRYCSGALGVLRAAAILASNERRCIGPETLHSQFTQRKMYKV